jgi:REP element-mobilizing transposase RayT
MPYIRVWIHFVWSTKNRQNMITQQLKPKLLNHILDNAKSKKIFIDEINCTRDHCHALISLSTEQTISKIVGTHF